jgi:hypothetical protein
MVMIARGETGALIDEREARLRVIAAVCATIIVGWEVYWCIQLPRILDPRILLSAAGFLLGGAIYCWAPISRALGGPRVSARSLPWMMASGFVFYLPFLRLMRLQIESDFQMRPLVLLGIASVLVLAVLAIAGWRFDRRPVTS